MSAWFQIDARGRLTPEDSEAERELASRPGRFRLARSGKDLLCLWRVPPTGSTIPTPRAVLVGDAATFPISDLIAFLSQARWTGAIRVQAPGGERSVMLQGGEVRGATSDDLADRLSEVIVRLGFLGRRQLEEEL
jgi:hypothetical protein